MGLCSCDDLHESILKISSVHEFTLGTPLQSFATYFLGHRFVDGVHQGIRRRHAHPRDIRNVSAGENAENDQGPRESRCLFTIHYAAPGRLSFSLYSNAARGRSCLSAVSDIATNFASIGSKKEKLLHRSQFFVT